jgi:NAD(P)-dependent dehydrogenase (short-subunit alcohol dehydrogenase family)
MTRVFISGSSTGLGLMAGQFLVRQGHEVVLHARNDIRAEDTRRAMPEVAAVVVGDLATIAGTKSVADQVNALGRFDAVIHNAAVGYLEPFQKTADGLLHLVAINTLAAYILTALIDRPRRLVYMSSGMHRAADANLDDITWSRRSWQGSTAYSESKLHDAILAFALARRWKDVRSNAVEPGWVATRMGGPGAPDDLQKGCETQSWLAVGEDPATNVSGKYFFHQKEREPNPQSLYEDIQDRLIEICERLSGARLP